MSNFIPREDRVQAWAAGAFERGRAGGAIEAGIAAINAAFGNNRRVNDHKLAVERAIRRGAGDIKNVCDFGSIAMQCPVNVTGALAEIERSYQAEIRDRRRRERSGFPTRNPNHERRLAQARLFLRWYRRFGDDARFAGVVDALTTSPVYAQAAE
ncbi:hypothetical protein I6F35_33460 [Bradyrhizobium sp. BRP22]|uniref:hypothetical protein n=1 Tax=Bradyrhizobium sp. BRP22 TaxID=2793821 RepID=UPI001CD7666F|nr:hypothetical protein [Bradyrhizobium sp. BRP22]MCA1458043.1 hypothetical protein [Bradyrhizobium sp. BRP22]